jgi:hypothetical protein
MDIGERTIINLAYEGVPQCAIARALQLPLNEVSEIVASAVASGRIIEPPGNDWPAGARASRQPVFTSMIDEGQLVIAAAKEFGLTKTQATILLNLLRKPHCPHELLHSIIESRRKVNLESIDPKIVSVFICNIRKRLHGKLTIRTVPGSGYFVHENDRRRATEQLLNCMGITDGATVRKLTRAA